jgi:hypothetical protein
MRTEDCKVCEYIAWRLEELRQMRQSQDDPINQDIARVKAWQNEHESATHNKKAKVK